MPWTPLAAHQHTHKARTPHEKSVWSKISNQVLKRTSDEGRAIREANGVVGRMAGSRK